MSAAGAATRAILICVDDVKQLFVRLRSLTTGEDFAPPGLRGKIVSDVEEKASNMNDVVMEILARRYSVPFEPKHRRTAPAAASDILPLRVPGVIRDAIDRACAGTGRNRQDEVLVALCENYGLDPADARKRNGPQRLRAAA